MPSLKEFIREIHRRSLWQVLSIYLVSGWIVYQIVLDLVEGLGLPGWFPSFAVALLLLGLPIVLATAVVQEGPGPEAGAPEVESRPGRERSQPTRRLFTWRNTILGGMAAFALWGVFAAGWILMGAGATPMERSVGAAVAVLPFKTIGDDPENQYFSEGIHEDIIQHLSQIEGLKVISRTSVMGYVDAVDLDLRDVARTLNVTAILEGSVRRDSLRVRVVAQLIDGESEGHLWAESYDRHLTDVFAIQSDIARRIADELAITLSPEEQDRVARKPTEHPAAYEEYLKGRFHWNRRSAAGLRRAIEHFDSALEIDPAYARALAGLADAYLLLPYYAGESPEDSRDLVQRTAARALELDPRLAESHATLGLLYTDWDRDLSAGETEYRRAIELNPNYATAWQWLALNLWFQGRPEEALATSRRARELDPLAPIIRENRIHYHLALGDPESALAEVDEVMSLAPEFTPILDNAALVHLVLGDVDRARDWIERLDPTSGTTTAVIRGYVLTRSGEMAELAHLRDALEARARTEFVSPTALATLSGLLGDTAAAAAYHRRAGRGQDPWRNYIDGIVSLLRPTPG